MSPTKFEPAIPASEKSQTHALDGAATGIGAYSVRLQLNALWEITLAEELALEEITDLLQERLRN
jgi:hypothetical protein